MYLHLSCIYHMYDGRSDVYATWQDKGLSSQASSLFSLEAIQAVTWLARQFPTWQSRPGPSWMAHLINAKFALLAIALCMLRKVGGTGGSLHDTAFSDARKACILKQNKVLHIMIVSKKSLTHQPLSEPKYGHSLIGQLHWSNKRSLRTYVAEAFPDKLLRAHTLWCAPRCIWFCKIQSVMIDLGCCVYEASGSVVKTGEQRPCECELNS